MARGGHFNHKNKNHPGKFPKDNGTAKHSEEAIEDEELIVVQEAFKNRLEEDETRGDTNRWFDNRTE